jgi:hypothetical protein
VNRLGHLQLKENLEKKMALMKLEDIFQHEHAMAKKLCNKKHGVEIKLIN